MCHHSRNCSHWNHSLDGGFSNFRHSTSCLSSFVRCSACGGKFARSGSRRSRGSKRRSMRAGSKGKSRGGKGRALIKGSSSGRSSLASHHLKGKVTKKSSKKDKVAPKHAIGSFFHFISYERELAKKQRLQLPPVTEWTRAIAAKWRGMTAEEQHPFHEKAQQDKMRYKREMAMFNGKKSNSASNRPLQSGFLVFLDDFRKGNTGDSKDIVKGATMAWSKISNTKKRMYQQRACSVRL